jgi:hypothetical protein
MMNSSSGRANLVKARPDSDSMDKLVSGAIAFRRPFGCFSSATRLGFAQIYSLVPLKKGGWPFAMRNYLCCVAMPFCPSLPLSKVLTLGLSPCTGTFGPR